MLEFSIVQLIQALGKCMEYWYPAEVQLPDEDCDMENQEKSVLEVPGNATVVLTSVEERMYYIAMKSSWLRPNITSAMGDVRDCFLATLDGIVSAITTLGSGRYTYALEGFTM